MLGKKCVIAIFAGVLLFFFTMSAGALASGQTISEKEKRELAHRPEFSAENLAAGSYLQGWENFLADHVPARDQFLTAAEQVKATKGIGGSVSMVQINADLGVPSKDSAPEIKQDLIVLPDRLLEVYQSSGQYCDLYANTINQFAQALPEGIQLYSMVIPLPVEFADEPYKSAGSPEKPDIRRIYRKLDSRIKTVDVYSELEKHADEPIYFRTDHHWTALGAYYGMRAFSQQADFEPLSLSRYHKNTIPGYLGQLYRMAPSPNLEKNPDTISYYLLNRRNNKTDVFFYNDEGEYGSFQDSMIDLSQAEDTPSYGVFLGGDYPMVVISGSVENGRVLAIVKDSYGNVFAPWLTPYFEKIIVIDPRGFHEDLNEMLEEYEVTDLLMLNYLKVTMLPTFMGYISDLLQ